MRVVVDKNNPQVEEAFRQFGEVQRLRNPRDNQRGCPRCRHDYYPVGNESDEEICWREAGLNLSERLRSAPTMSTSIISNPVELDLRVRPARTQIQWQNILLRLFLRLHSGRDSLSQEKRVGVVGVGNVGSKIVRNAKALGMQVLQNDPPLARETGNPSFVPLDDLMDADIITLHVPLTKTGSDPTFHLFGESTY